MLFLTLKLCIVLCVCVYVCVCVCGCNSAQASELKLSPVLGPLSPVESSAALIWMTGWKVTIGWQGSQPLKPASQPVSLPVSQAVRAIDLCFSTGEVEVIQTALSGPQLDLSREKLGLWKAQNRRYNLAYCACG